MRHAAKLARDDAITDALRVVNDAIGNEEPTQQAFRIINAIKALRTGSVRITTGGTDYLRNVQELAQAAWLREHGKAELRLGDEYQATAGINTPLGRLHCTTWRTAWKGQRLVWASEYTLADEPITVREIKKAGLAQRPTTRNRQKKEPKP